MVSLESICTLLTGAFYALLYLCLSHTLCSAFLFSVFYTLWLCHFLSVSLYAILFGFLSLVFITVSVLSLSLFSILYTLWFFGCHYFFSVFSILFGSLVVTISLVSSLYAILFGLPLVVSGYLSPVSLQMLFLTVQWLSKYLLAFG